MYNIDSNTLFYGFVVGTVIYVSYFLITTPVCHLNIFFLDEHKRKTRLDIVLLHSKESGFIPVSLMHTMLEESGFKDVEIVGIRMIYSRGFYPQILFRKTKSSVKFFRK